MATPTTDPTPEGGGILPPYSGEQTTCAKCAHDCAATIYRPGGPVAFYERSDCRLMRGELPERLERMCERCGYQWDEALCPPGPGMTVEALAHAVTNAAPYPVELPPEACTYIARYLLGCLLVAARTDHPLWQYSAGRPSPTVPAADTPTTPAPKADQ